MKVDTFNVLEVLWLNSGNFGIVKVETEYDGIKFYGKSITPTNQVDDITEIVKWGNTIDPAVMTNFMSS